MALMGCIALYLYAGAAFALGWFFRGDHDRTKEEKHHARTDD